MATFRVPVAPSVLAWALDRSGTDPHEIRGQFKDLAAWLNGTKLPTYGQLEHFASKTHTPLGDFFLLEPPVDEVPIPDFRTIGNSPLRKPSPDLLETIYLCEQRQEWYQQHAMASGADPLRFVGSVGLDSPPVEMADLVRRQLQFELNERRQDESWSAALRRLIGTAEDAGVLVMVSGIVGNNTHRALNPEEFRGFTLSDSYAPLVFVNGADTKAAQIFTLVHEICHLWLGQTALTDASMNTTNANATELWCNRVAAEVLVPKTALADSFRDSVTTEELERLARIFKVSTLVILKSLFDSRLIPWAEFSPGYDAELLRLQKIMAARGSASGGDFYNTQPLRVSRRFARAIITDTNTGRTLHRDAYRLLGTKKFETFSKLGERVGAP